MPFCQWKAENTVSFPKCAVNLAHSESGARADSWLSQTKMIPTERFGERVGVYDATAGSIFRGEINKLKPAIQQILLYCAVCGKKAVRTHRKRVKHEPQSKAHPQHTWEVPRRKGTEAK